MHRQTRALIACLTLAATCCAAGPVLAEESATQPVTQPATKRGRTVIKVQAKTDADKPDAVAILVDVNDAPELKDWGLQAANKALEWHPKLAAFLASDGFSPPREVTLRFKKINAPGQAFGSTIECSINWVTKNPEDFGMVAHEMVHVIQQYKKPGPGWLTEGIADYVRYYVIEPGSPRARFDINRSNYKSGYQPTAGLLNFVETKHPGTVAKLNAAMREGKYSDDIIKEVAGADWDALWDQFKASKAKPEKKAS